MKNLFRITLLLFSMTVVCQTSRFNTGYQKGYKEGYCYQEYGCIPPITPLTPLPRISESSNSYKDGYQRGFLDGKATKNKDLRTLKSTTNYPILRNYPNYIRPYDFDLLYKTLRVKQREYEQIRRNKAKKIKSEYYAKLVLNKKEQSFIYYNQAYELTEKYQDLIDDFKAYKIYVESLNPNKITNKYLNDLSYNKAKNFISELDANNKKLLNLVNVANEIIKYFSNRPNNIIIGAFQTGKLNEYVYNQNTGNYNLKNVPKVKSMVAISKDRILYARSDKDNVTIKALRYEGIKEGVYIFYDGTENLLVIERDLKTFHLYHDVDKNSQQYLKKTTYFNMKKLNFDNK